ncbi:MAG: hypothetical protein ACHQC8_02505 [Solirubrobacterales bacterium]
MPETTGENHGEANRVGILAGGKVFGFDRKYLFGTPEEVDNRAGDTGYPKDRDPSLRPAAFVQIPPVAKSSRILNDVDFAHRAGDIKFSDGI